MNRIRGYLGTYASPESQGIYSFTLDKDTGRLTVPELLCEAPDCKYLSLFGGTLAAPVKREVGSGLILCHLNPDGGLFEKPQEVLSEQVPSCYVAQEGGYVYTANYHEGTVRIYQKNDDRKIGSMRLGGAVSHDMGRNGTGNSGMELSGMGLSGAGNGGGQELELVHTIENGRGAGCHQVLIHGPYLLVSCLLQDRLRFFSRENGFAPAGEIKFPKGTGPRHGIFDREHKRFFLVSELSNQIFSYETAEDNNFILRGAWDILKNKERGKAAPASAAIRLSPDQRYLYVSTRFADLLTVYRVDGTELTLVQQISSSGAGPRDFMITEDGGYLLAVNRSEGGLVCFRLDPENGTIGKLCSRVPAAEAVSIVLNETELTERNRTDRV